MSYLLLLTAYIKFIIQQVKTLKYRDLYLNNIVFDKSK